MAYFISVLITSRGIYVKFIKKKKMHLLSYFVLLLYLLSFGKAESLEKAQAHKKVVLITGASRGIGLATASI